MQAATHLAAPIVDPNNEFNCVPYKLVGVEPVVFTDAHWIEPIPFDANPPAPNKLGQNWRDESTASPPV